MARARLDVEREASPRLPKMVSFDTPRQGG